MKNYPKELRKKLILYYIFKIFNFPLFWLPVLPLYLGLDKGFEPYLVTFVLSIQEFLLIFLEVPTGVVADKVSRKLSVALGTFIMSFSFVFLPFVNSLYLIILIFIVKAIGKAFISGSDSSLLYDMLLDYNLKDEYKVIRNRAHAFGMLFAAFSVLIGGIVAQYSMDLVMMLSFPFLLIGSLAMSFIKEPEVSKKAKEIQSSNYVLHVKDSLNLLKGVKGSIYLLLVYVIVESLLVNLKYLYSPIFGSLNINFAIIGGITFIIYLLKAVSLYFATKIIRGDSKLIMIRFSLYIVLAFLLFLVFRNVYATALGLFIGMFFGESMNIVIDQEWQDNLNSSVRATAASTLNLFSSIASTLFLNIFGIFQTKSMTYSIFFIVILFLSAFIFSIKYRKITQF